MLVGFEVPAIVPPNPPPEFATVIWRAPAPAVFAPPNTGGFGGGGGAWGGGGIDIIGSVPQFMFIGL